MSTSKKKVKPKAKKAPARKAPAPKVSKTKKAAKVAVKEKPKKAAPKPKKEAPAKAVVKAEPLELGPPPGAIVASRHIDALEERAGRGFSFGELSTAGVPLNVARREGLSVDVRRRSVVAMNVEALKGWLKNPAPVRK